MFVLYFFLFVCFIHVILLFLGFSLFFLDSTTSHPHWFGFLGHILSGKKPGCKHFSHSHLFMPSLELGKKPHNSGEVQEEMSICLMEAPRGCLDGPSATCVVGLLLPWSTGQGQQDMGMAVLGSPLPHRVPLSPECCVSPKLSCPLAQPWCPCSAITMAAAGRGHGNPVPGLGSGQEPHNQRVSLQGRTRGWTPLPELGAGTHPGEEILCRASVLSAPRGFTTL